MVEGQVIRFGKNGFQGFRKVYSGYWLKIFVGLKGYKSISGTVDGQVYIEGRSSRGKVLSPTKKRQAVFYVTE